jgi:hypothetical protein
MISRRRSTAALGTGGKFTDGEAAARASDHEPLGLHKDHLRRANLSFHGSDSLPAFRSSFPTRNNKGTRTLPPTTTEDKSRSITSFRVLVWIEPISEGSDVH